MKQLLHAFRCALVAILSLCATGALHAQALPQSPIGVEMPGAGTKYYRTLDEAFSEVKKSGREGCTIIIPSGTYALSNTEEVHLNKRVNIFGAGAKGTSKTVVNGFIKLLAGADGSLIQGIHFTDGGAIFSNRTALVNLIFGNSNRYDSSSSLWFSYDTYGNRLSSCWLKGAYIDGGGTNLVVLNTTMRYIKNVIGGIIENCVLYGSFRDYPSSYVVYKVEHSRIANTLVLTSSSWYIRDSQVVGCIQIGREKVSDEQGIELLPSVSWNDIFVKVDNNNSLDPELNDWHLKSDSPAKGKGTNGSDPGLYGGAGFDDKMMSPLPRVVITEAPTKTNEEGKLLIKVRIDQN